MATKKVNIDIIARDKSQRALNTNQQMKQLFDLPT